MEPAITRSEAGAESSQPQTAPLRIGLVGTGIGRLHAAGIAQTPEVMELTAVCARSHSSAQALAAGYAVPLVTGDYEEVLRSPDVEAVDLCVPHHLHLPMALAAARAGKHILVEKPIARTLSEADEMIAAARDAGVCLMVGHNMRYYGQHAKARELLDAGAIGKPYMIVASCHVYGQIGGFRRSLAQSGGGTLIDSGVHRFDLIRWLMGDVALVFAQRGNFLQPQMEGEDCAAVTMRFRDGAIGSFTCSWSAKAPEYEETLQIFGPLGSIITENYRCSLKLRSEASLPGLENVREFVFPIDQTESIRRCLAAFAQNVRAGTRLPIPGEEGRAALELTLASYLAADTGQPVSLPVVP